MRYNLDQIKAVIIVGGCDFGRCPVAERLNRAFWPISDRTALQYMIDEISRQGVRHFVICQSQELQMTLNLPDSVEVEYKIDRLPRGTAGCLKEVLSPEKEELLIVFQSILVTIPDISALFNEHKNGDALVTLFSHPENETNASLNLAPMYCCESSILNYIPDSGYFDFKEGLVPALVRANQKIHIASVNQPIRNFRDWTEYLQLLTDRSFGLKPHIDQTAQIASSARIIGDVVIGQKTKVCDHAVLVGPVVIGADCSVGHGAFVSDAVLWDGAEIGPQCQIQNSVVDAGKAVSGFKVYRGVLLADSHSWASRLRNTVIRWMNRYIYAGRQLRCVLADCWDISYYKVLLMVSCLAMLCAVTGLYWIPTITGLVKIWTSSDEYSSGMLVPMLAALVLWLQRKTVAACPVRPAIWIGGGLLLLAQAARIFGLYYMYSSVENLSLIASFASLIVMIFGMPLTLRLWPVLLFLCLMLPLPRRIQSWIGLPLQEWATASAVFVLEAFGFSVLRQGNVINLNGTMVAVAEACNGLRMLTAFMVVCAMVVLVMRRTMLEKALVLISCIPIAMLCNTLRLAITSVAFTVIDSEKWEKTFHDYGGLAMMPLALFLIIGELWLFGRLFCQTQSTVSAAAEVIYRKVKD